MRILIADSQRGSLQHFTFSGTKFPLGAVPSAYACLGSSLPWREAGCPPQPHPSGKRGRAGGTPENHPRSRRAGWTAAWLFWRGSASLPPALPGFISWFPLQEHNLSLPNAVQKTTGDHSSCLRLPPLSLVIRRSSERG